MKTFKKKYNFKKKWLSDGSGYWYEMRLKTHLGKLVFTYVDDGSINSIELCTPSSTGKAKCYTDILITKDLPTYRRVAKKLIKIYAIKRPIII